MQKTRLRMSVPQEPIYSDNKGVDGCSVKRDGRPIVFGLCGQNTNDFMRLHFSIEVEAYRLIICIAANNSIIITNMHTIPVKFENNTSFQMEGEISSINLNNFIPIMESARYVAEKQAAEGVYPGVKPETILAGASSVDAREQSPAA